MAWLKIQLWSTTSAGLTSDFARAAVQPASKYGGRSKSRQTSTRRTRTTRRDDEATKEEHSEEGNGDDGEGLPEEDAKSDGAAEVELPSRRHRYRVCRLAVHLNMSSFWAESKKISLQKHDYILLSL